MFLHPNWIALLSVASAVLALQNEPRHVFSNPDEYEARYEIPTVHESAVMARRIMHLASHGDLVTTFPSDSRSVSNDNEPSTQDVRPTGLGGSPIGLIEYIADCESNTGNPTLLAINIATPYRNYRAGSNISLSLRWWPEEKSIYTGLSSLFYKQSDLELPSPHTAVALPRFSLHGRLEAIDMNSIHGLSIPPCFIAKHPDSVYWQPRGGVHASQYVRLIVEEVYWLGGFGDRAYIGWIPVEEWNSVTKTEIDECRLPGERKKKETFDWFREYL